MSLSPFWNVWPSTRTLTELRSANFTKRKTSHQRLDQCRTDAQDHCNETVNTFEFASRAMRVEV
eukprot:523084-Amphidinium_carterae.1